MIKWILLVVVNGSGATVTPSPTVAFQEFDTEIQCRYAAKLIYDYSRQGAKTACILKGASNG